MTEGPIRLSEVAREAGVSIATASHALSGKGRLPELTRTRVREVAKRMGYRPNMAARSLAGGRTRLIAVAFSLSNALPVPLTDVDYFNHAIRAATARALDHDYALVIAPPTPQTEVWSRLPFDGVVVFDPVEGDPVLAEFRRRRVPMVLSGRDPTGGSDYCVDNDHVAGTRTVLDHLAERGGRRIALLAGDTHDAFTEDCVGSYCEWCGEHGCEPMVTMVKQGNMANVAEAAQALEGPDPPDAVYANDEVLGVALLRAARRRRLHVPGDLMIAVAADRQPAGTPVALTTLELDAAGTAARAVDMLIEILEGQPPDDRVRLIPTRLTPGQSTERV
jgi:DNA-binding LacI/PurR family transcriptional regulator